MMTVHEVSKLSGVSIRALHHYDRIGLFHPARVTEAGYRLYDDGDLERLQCILLFKELQFPLKEIKDSGKLLITPHIAWASVEARTRLVNTILGQIQDFFVL